jgi:SAM-dependent methyltransferase
MRRCRLCRSAKIGPLPFAIPASEGAWFHCHACGSDSSDNTYPDDLYSQDYEASEVAGSGGPEVRAASVRSNLDWFDRHHELGDDRTFLDVGCCDGAALRGMAALGWGVHGFDVFPPSYMGRHVTVAPVFNRWLFPRRYAAILCREVIEHVTAPDLLLHELHGAAIPGGLVQVQTPQPIDRYHPIPHQRAHLFLSSPGQLRKMLDAAMLDVLDSRLWSDSDGAAGQAYLCRARK